MYNSVVLLERWVDMAERLGLAGFETELYEEWNGDFDRLWEVVEPGPVKYNPGL